MPASPFDPGARAPTRFQLEPGKGCTVVGKSVRMSFVGVMIAMLCAAAVVINSGPAQAVETPSPETIALSAAGVGLLTPGVVTGGAAATGGTAAAGAVCATGIGCAAIAVIGLGVLAYATHDVWLPWVKNAVGEDKLASSGTLADYQFTFTRPPVAGKWYIGSTDPLFPLLNMSHNGAWGTVRYRVNIQCKTRDPTTLVESGWQTFEYDKNSLGGTSWSDTRPLRSCTSTDTTTTSHVMFRFANIGGSLTGGAPFTNMLTWQAGTVPSTATTRVQCRRPDGSTYVREAVTASPGDYVKASPCDPGDVMERVDLDVDGLPHESLDTRTTAAERTKYPLCSGAACLYAVHVDGSKCEVIGGKAVPSACHSWTTLATSSSVATRERVECWYGPYKVDTSLCNSLERIYESGTITGTKVNTDGAPDTYTDPAPGPAPSPSPSPSSTSTTSGSPSPTPTPTTAGEPAPSPDPTTDPDGAECWPNGWGWLNPSEWVLKPLRCAFVPDPAKVTAVRTAVGVDVARSGVGELVGAVQAPIDALSSGSGCSGITFDLPINGETFHGSILNACSGPMATAAHFSNILISLSVIIGGGMGLLRLAGAGFGYNVKVSDGD